MDFVLVGLGQTFQPCNSYSQNLNHMSQNKLLELSVAILAPFTRAHLSLDIVILCKKVYLFTKDKKSPEKDACFMHIEVVSRFDGPVLLSFLNEFIEIKLKSWLVANG